MSAGLRVFLVFLFPYWLASAPVFLDDQFELPPGFRIYRAAGPELSGGSYDLAFDGQGRLLVGDGNAVRRLSDTDGDGVFDSFEVIATGLGWRGPQGLLVYGDHLYAVGGDGIQVFEGYGSASGLVRQGRIGQPFRTGGDHEGHTIFRGHDGYLYFVSGDGGGTRDRLHITESNSPVLFERAASVFRISPDGKHWECVSAGGRNPPNVGQNYLGDLFSFDSDMEWHVGLPWWRPVRLNHWLIGGDQGWQEVGAYPPYFIDCLPGILDVGRGSPTWGVFYEHDQFPARYRDAYLVCDYRWKRESNDQYATSGRLVAFVLQRIGAGWKATMETLVRPKPDARDSTGKPISFALIDMEVAPDGSVFVSDHNQGIWRIVYGSGGSDFAKIPAARVSAPLEALLELPQPASEWSRVAEEELKNKIGRDWAEKLQGVVVSPGRELRQRLRAVRLLAPEFKSLPLGFISKLARDKQPELRGQAAWLMGIRGGADAATGLQGLARDADPFVRRRAAEALTRVTDVSTETLLAAMTDPERLVRYAAMAALAHRPTGSWFERAASDASPHVRMRALIAAKMRRELPPVDAVRGTISALLKETNPGRENHLDLLRVLGLFQNQLSEAEMRQVSDFLLKRFPDGDRDVSFEQIRLLGAYRVNKAFPRLLEVLEREEDHVRQFHIAQSISKLEEGWSTAEEQRLLAWFSRQQRGWFAEFSGKGVEFPQFWATVLNEFAQHHRKVLSISAAQIDLESLLGSAYIDLLAAEPDGSETLVRLHETVSRPSLRTKIARRLAQFQGSCSTRHVQIVEEAFLSNAEPEAAKPLAEFLARRSGQNRPEPICEAAIRYMEQQRSVFQTMAGLLGAVSGTNFPVKMTEGRIDATERERVAASWRAWFKETFKRDAGFVQPQAPEKSDEEVYRRIVGNQLPRGDATRGGRTYEMLQCNTCHGGGVTPGREGRIFGPDLAGAGRRLNRAELADSLIYPSKQVPDRFKAYEVTLKDGVTLTGFITEQNERQIAFVERDQVRQLTRSEIGSIKPQTTSLMPEKLLNRLSDQELADLLAFLEK
jgi:putative heme-binding domain-containing protein